MHKAMRSCRRLATTLPAKQAVSWHFSAKERGFSETASRRTAGVFNKSPTT